MFAVGRVWRGEVFEFLGDVVSIGVRVSGFIWSVRELAAVNLASKVAAPRPTLALFWNFLHRRWESKVIFSYILITHLASFPASLRLRWSLLDSEPCP